MYSTSRSVDIAIIGAGTAGMYALRQARKAHCSALLIDHGPLGTTCARVGCMPSKAALHVAHLWEAAREAARFGYPPATAMADRRAAWHEVRRQRDFFAGRTAERTQQFAGDSLLMGSASFIAADAVRVMNESGEGVIVQAKAFVLAVGSRPFVPAALHNLPAERLLTSDSLFECDEPPARVGIIGLGAIGLEMGLALSRLGVSVIGVEMGPMIAGISDPEVNAAALARFGRYFPIYSNTTATFTAAPEGIVIELPDGSRHTVDALLVATGRRSNLDRMALTEAGVALDSRGFPTQFDPTTLQIANAPIFLAGDAHGRMPLMHEAAADGVAAGTNAARWVKGQPLVSRSVLTPLAIVFSNPDVVRVGKRFAELDHERIVIGTGKGSENGRSRILGETETLLRLYVEKPSGRLLGAEMVVAHGEHLGHFLAQAIARGETVEDLLALPYYHPTVEELLQSALQEARAQLARANS